MNFEQIFKNIDNVLYTDAGADSEIDYISQTSWVLFLRYLHDLEQDKADTAELRGNEYEYILEEKYRWPNWAMPKGKDGKIDHHAAMTGDDLIKFVDRDLFPYLKTFSSDVHAEDTVQNKIGIIFGDLDNRIKSGYNLREIIELVDSLEFKTSKQKHELSHLYETKIKQMGNAGRSGGQYYTPRPLIRAMINVTDPQIGETVYDGAAGSGGFLVEAFEQMEEKLKAEGEQSSTKSLETLQRHTFYGKEVSNVAYIIGMMNMILHGIESPNLVRVNTLATHQRDVQEKDRYDVILANPPFGGNERKEVQQNFDIKTGETAFLFLQHFVKYLKAGGRSAIVIKNTFLSNTDNASVALRKHLLDTCNVHTILDMPSGTFQGAGVKTVVLFFQKGQPTKDIWYYQLNPGRNMGKTNPLNDKDLAEFVELQRTKVNSPNSWTLNLAALNENTADLSVKNPNIVDEAPLRDPQEIIADIKKLESDNAKILDEISKLL